MKKKWHFEFWISGEKVTKKQMCEAYGYDYIKDTLEWIKEYGGGWSTTYLNGGYDEINAWYY